MRGVYIISCSYTRDKKSVACSDYNSNPDNFPIRRKFTVPESDADFTEPGLERKKRENLMDIDKVEKVAEAFLMRAPGSLQAGLGAHREPRLRGDLEEASGPPGSPRGDGG